MCFLVLGTYVDVLLCSEVIRSLECPLIDLLMHNNIKKKKSFQRRQGAIQDASFVKLVCCHPSNKMVLLLLIWVLERFVRTLIPLYYLWILWVSQTGSVVSHQLLSHKIKSRIPLSRPLRREEAPTTCYMTHARLQKAVCITWRSLYVALSLFVLTELKAKVS